MFQSEPVLLTARNEHLHHFKIQGFLVKQLFPFKIAPHSITLPFRAISMHSAKSSRPIEEVVHGQWQRRVNQLPNVRMTGSHMRLSVLSVDVNKATRVHRSFVGSLLI